MWGTKKVQVIEKKPDIKLEVMRAKSQRQKVLLLLKRLPAGTVTNIDLSRIGLNYTMRVSELRKDGHQIQAVYEKPGVYRYFYKGQDA